MVTEQEISPCLAEETSMNLFRFVCSSIYWSPLIFFGTDTILVLTSSWRRCTVCKIGRLRALPHRIIEMARETRLWGDFWGKSKKSLYLILQIRHVLFLRVLNHFFHYIFPTKRRLVWFYCHLSRCVVFFLQVWHDQKRGSLSVYHVNTREVSIFMS